MNGENKGTTRKQGCTKPLPHCAPGASGVQVHRGVAVVRMGCGLCRIPEFWSKGVLGCSDGILGNYDGIIRKKQRGKKEIDSQLRALVGLRGSTE